MAPPTRWPTAITGATVHLVDYWRDTAGAGAGRRGGVARDTVGDPHERIKIEERRCSWHRRGSWRDGATVDGREVTIP
jgi:hypothetical protein